jgi:beta-glucanase (GH16 family)
VRIFLSVCLAGGFAGAAAAQSLPPPIAKSGYVLTFADDFTTGSISSGSVYDGAKWYNGTEQCCMSDSTGLAGVMYPTPAGGRAIDPYVEKNGLTITLRKIKTAQTTVWTSGVMTSVDAAGAGFSMQYGYVQVVAKLPVGPGTWPAFWLLNTAQLQNQSSVGEIDIMEQYGQFPMAFCTTLHDWTGGTTPFQSCPNVAPVNLTAEYHKYGMWWTASTMRFYLDNRLLYSTPTPAVMNQPYYLLLDLGLGGGWPTGSTPNIDVLHIKSVEVFAPPS